MKFKLLYITLFGSILLNAQVKQKDTLNTEVINVVKPFKPSVSDAFKINRNPQLKADSTRMAKHFTYRIFSVPVASTFKPQRGNFVGLKMAASSPIYHNFISAGFGNYSRPYFESFMHGQTAKSDDLGLYLKYTAAKDGVKKALLNNDYSDLRADVYYKKYESKFDWQVNTGMRYQSYNWYGLTPLMSLSTTQKSAIKPQQKYNYFYAGGTMVYYNSIFQGGTFEYNFFSDDYKTSENQVHLAPEFSFPIATEYLTTQFTYDYLDGKFDRAYLSVNPISYQYSNLGFHPNLEINRANFSFNLGLRLYYSKASKATQYAQFFSYPNLTVSYRFSQSGLTAFAGLTGDLHQNSYYQLAKQNPYVSPTLNIQQTDEAYKGFIGIKGLSKNLTYHFKISYKNENNKALFVLNPAKAINATNRAYDYGNSFDVVYDDIKTLEVKAGFKSVISKFLSIGTDVHLTSYQLTNELEAWNLPTLKAKLFADYNYKNWFANAQIFIEGQRKGRLSHLFPTFTIASPKMVNNAAFVDANLTGGYVFSDRLKVFLKLNNLLNDNYFQFTNYEVMGFQALAGLTYKFDF